MQLQAVEIIAGCEAWINAVASAFAPDMALNARFTA
jgi:hypothetical protein